jgi:hypothetical protein
MPRRLNDFGADGGQRFMFATGIENSYPVIRGRVNPLGLYDLDRKIRPVGEAYKQMVAEWRGILPVESRSLHLNTSLAA